MNNTKKLLSINNLKKYFPIAKSSIFQREQFFVKANEDISIDIHEGETFSLVGESGCGKSTLGRVILQLYNQTAGSTIYYGRMISDIAPRYVYNILINPNKYIAAYNKMFAKAEEAKKIVEDAGGDEKASFIQLQNRNILTAEAATLFAQAARVLGGFFSLEDPVPGAKLELARFKADTALADQKKINKKLGINIDLLTDQIENSTESKKTISLEKRLNKLKAKLASGKEKENALRAVRNERLAEVRKYKEQFANDEKFQECEKYSDGGIDLSLLKYKEMRGLRKDLQIIFQDPYSSLNPRMTIGQIIEEGLVTHDFFKHGSSKMKEYILETMRSAGLQDYMLHRYPHQFSGGQRQRICIARALAVQPKFVVCDECVSALDVSIQSQIINLLDELKEKNGLTYLFISHDLSVVRYISDRIGVMYLGNLVEVGDTETIFSDPRHPYTVALLSSIPTTDIDDLKKERIILEGNIPSPVRPPEGCKFHTRCYMACEKCKRVPPELVEIEKGHFVACHFPEKKLDEQGNYLFKINKEAKEEPKE